MEENGPKTTTKPQANLFIFTLVGAVHNRFVHVPGLLFKYTYFPIWEMYRLCTPYETIDHNLTTDNV